MIRNVIEYLENSVALNPDKIAFADTDEKLSFKMLEEAAKSIGSWIGRKQVFRCPIAVYMDKGVKCIAAFMGIVYSGNFYVPIDTQMPEARVKKIFDTLSPAYIITDSKNTNKLMEMNSANWNIVLYEDLLVTEIENSILQEIRLKIIDTDILYVLFTSGSTGTPKGVIITHRSVVDYTEWVTGTFSITENEVFGNQAPFYFDNSILDIYCTLKNAATMYIIPKELFAQPIKLLHYLEEYKINCIFWVPSAMIMVSRSKVLGEVDISNIKKVLFCGEVMPNKCLNAWRKALPNAMFANLYGPTEITDVCTYYIVNREFADEEALPIGIPCYNTRVYVLNEKNEPVKGNEIGELCVSGTSLALGYYNNPEKTKEAFVQNPLQQVYSETIYRTGDLVRYNEFGELMYISRKDFQIKHKGHRIELGEIETAVSSLSGVALCCCLYDEKRSKIVLFLEATCEKEDLNELKKLIPDYMYPGKVVYVEKMPMNANGKIDRVKLKEML